MSIFARVREVIINPQETWHTIKQEPVNIKQLFINYAAPLALIPAVCNLVGFTLLGIRTPANEIMRAPFFEALLGGLLGYFFHLAGVLVSIWFVNLLAPVFSSKSDMNTSAKVVIYAMTPTWLVGVFSILPGLGILSILGLYGVYLLVLAFPILLETPPKKVVWYTLSVLAVGFIVSFILSMVVIAAFYGPMYMRMIAT